jgi:predicted nucleic acid-binding protein
MFVDTNVLISARFLEAPDHEAARAGLENALAPSEPLRISRRIDVGGKQIHDANIVATMLAYGERRLLTFNVADFRRYVDHIEFVAG